MYANPPKRPTVIRAAFLNVESLSSDLELTAIVIVSSLLSYLLHLVNLLDLI